MSSLNAPNEILILTDGKMGDLVQCRGIAQFISSQDHITEIKLETGVFSSLLLPWGFIPTALQSRQPQQPFRLPVPRHGDRLRAADGSLSQGFSQNPQQTIKRPFTVFLKDPRVPS